MRVVRNLKLDSEIYAADDTVILKQLQNRII